MNIENGGPSEEEMDPDGLTMEERAMAEAFLADYPDKNLPENERRDCEAEVVEFNSLLESFESKHSLEALNAIIELDPKDAPNHPIRESARKDLIPIVALMNALKEETNISKERHDELKAKYLILSQAVGIINNGKVRH